jgi:large subunit ribosomal protein L13
VIKAQELRHDWYVVDASSAPLGRLASRAARILMGKHKAAYTPHLDNGDYVVVVNASKAVLTGQKETDKIYRHHTGFPGGLRQSVASQVRARHPERLVEDAVRGMLPKTKLGKRQLRKLKVYRGADHPHAAQRPRPLSLKRA